MNGLVVVVQIIKTQKSVKECASIPNDDDFIEIIMDADTSLFLKKD